MERRGANQMAPPMSSVGGPFLDKGGGETQASRPVSAPQVSSEDTAFSLLAGPRSHDWTGTGRWDLTPSEDANPAGPRRAMISRDGRYRPSEAVPTMNETMASPPRQAWTPGGASVVTTVSRYSECQWGLR